MSLIVADASLMCVTDACVTDTSLNASPFFKKFGDAVTHLDFWLSIEDSEFAKINMNLPQLTADFPRLTAENFDCQYRAANSRVQCIFAVPGCLTPLHSNYLLIL